MASSVGSTDLNLIFRAQQRDPDAWEALVDLYGPWIYGWTRRLGLSADDGADATQETLLAVHRSLDQFAVGSPAATFRGWLWTVLKNKVIDQQRRHHSEQRPPRGTAMERQVLQIPDAPPDDSSDPVAISERAALLLRALEQVRGEFEPRSWQAFWMAVVDGRTTGEVAAQLGMSAMAVRQAKSRILRRLRQQLGESGPTSG
jgi:RNA polymerase sigma-70 factor (ECF subfamily)